MVRPERVLVAGVSTRAAAESAARAGFAVTAIDAFGDLDHHAAVRALSLPRDFGAPMTAAAVARASRAIDCDAVAYVSNVDNHPGAVATLTAGRWLWGNPASVLDVSAIHCCANISDNEVWLRRMCSSARRPPHFGSAGRAPTGVRSDRSGFGRSATLPQHRPFPRGACRGRWLVNHWHRAAATECAPGVAARACRAVAISRSSSTERQPPSSSSRLRDMLCRSAFPVSW